MSQATETAPIDVVVHKPQVQTINEWLAGAIAVVVGFVLRTVVRLAWWLAKLAWRAVAWAAPRFPRVVVGAYAVGWGVAGVPLWVPGWGWWNVALVAVNPVTVTAVFLTWWLKPGAPDTASMDHLVAVWRTQVAGTYATDEPDGDGVWVDETAPLPGSWVHPTAKPVVDEHGQEIGGTLLVKGRNTAQHAGEIEKATPALAYAYQTLPDGITVTPHDYSTVKVQILHGWYLRERAQQAEARMQSAHPWTEPTLDVETGNSAIVVVEDGSAGLFAHYEPGVGSYHSWMVGPTRRGKSVALSAILIDITAHGIAYPVILDMGPKPSLQEWDWHEAYTRTPEQAKEWLRRVDLEMVRRGRYMEENRLRVLDPSPEWPQIPVVVDEAPQIVNDYEVMVVVKRIATIGAGMGVPLRWSSQMADYADAFGYTGGTTLRSQVQAGNVLCFASEDDMVSKALDGSPAPVRPWRIPRNIKGTVVLYGNEHPVPVMGRTVHLVDPDREVKRWVRIPAYALPVLSTEDVPTVEADTVATASPKCREAVWAEFDALDAGDRLDAEVLLGKLAKPAGPWSRSSVYAALKGLAGDGLIVNGAKGEWAKS